MSLSVHLGSPEADAPAVAMRSKDREEKESRGRGHERADRRLRTSRKRKGKAREDMPLRTAGEMAKPDPEGSRRAGCAFTKALAQVTGAAFEATAVELQEKRAIIVLESCGAKLKELTGLLQQKYAFFKV